MRNTYCGIPPAFGIPFALNPLKPQLGANVSVDLVEDFLIEAEPL